MKMTEEKPMTVGGVIKKLQEFDPDLPVYGSAYDTIDDYNPSPIKKIIKTQPHQYNDEFEYVLIA